MYFLISVKNNFTVERGRTIQICFRALNIFYFLRRRWQHRSVCVCVQTRDITIRSSSSAPQSAALNRQSRCRPRWWCSRQRRMWGVCQEQRGALGVRCCHIAETRGRDLESDTWHSIGYIHTYIQYLAVYVQYPSNFMSKLSTGTVGGKNNNSGKGARNKRFDMDESFSLVILLWFLFWYLKIVENSVQMQKQMHNSLLFHWCLVKTTVPSCLRKWLAFKKKKNGILHKHWISPVWSFNCWRLLTVLTYGLGRNRRFVS